MAKRIALIGGGGHALSLLDILPSPAKVAGYVDFSPMPCIPADYLGDDSTFISTCPPDEWEIIITMVSGADCSLRLRRDIIGRYGNYDSPVVTASTAIISPSATIGKGSAVFHRAVINAATAIGEHSIINTGAIIEHGCTIGDNVFVGPGAVICGGVTIGDNSYIGAGAIIKPCMTLCQGCTIGAGAVVVRDIDTPDTYAGVPAKSINRK